MQKSIEMTDDESDLVESAATRLGTTVTALLQDRSLRDIIRQEAFSALDEMIQTGSIPPDIITRAKESSAKRLAAKGARG